MSQTIYAEDLTSGEGLNIAEMSDVVIKEAVPVEVTEFDVSEKVFDSQKVKSKVSIDQSKIESIDELLYAEEKYNDNLKFKTFNASDTAVILSGTVSDVLSGTGDYKLYSFSGVNQGIFLQAQLKQPNIGNLDYDLYILDANFNVVAASEYYTNISSPGEDTLAESVGYISPNSTTQTYYFWVVSSDGGSTSKFTLDFSVCTAYDDYEPDDNARIANTVTYGLAGISIRNKRICSPVDNDWYKIRVPYQIADKELNIELNTSSGNGCKLEVYKDVKNGYFKMEKVGFNGNGKIDASSGTTYYIRISSSNPNTFDVDKIGSYTLEIFPELTPDKIEILGFRAEHGGIIYPWGEPIYCVASWKLTVVGVLYITDPQTGINYGVDNEQIQIDFINTSFNPEEHPTLATVTARGKTDVEGVFEIELSLRNNRYWDQRDWCNVIAKTVNSPVLSTSVRILKETPL